MLPFPFHILGNMYVIEVCIPILVYVVPGVDRFLCIWIFRIDFKDLVGLIGCIDCEPNIGQSEIQFS